MARLLLLFSALLFCLGQISAQVFTPVFPNLGGPQLLDSLVIRYKPVVVLDYANARDTLYARVLAKDDDSLRCIYSGHTLYLDPTQDPTQYIYLNGGPLGMNTEHAYPQSKGAADGNPRSDMHHLFPARIPVNEARGSLPYSDIPDNQTQQWFIKAQVYTTAPTQDRDLYTEARPGAFEPRESVKGDLARAIFYFYTMYRAQADAADPAFFAGQRATLCQWHQQDPADSAELIKTWRIAAYQENKPNPYILDCTLARRTFCPELTGDCATTATTEPGSLVLGMRLSPNPLAGPGQLEMELPFSGALDIRLFSVLGAEIAKWQIPDAEAGTFRLALEPGAAGDTGRLGFLVATLRRDGRQVRQTIPVVLW